MPVQRQEVKLVFNFNTQIVAFKDGDFKKVAFEKQVQALYARVKYNDGISSCCITQWYMTVEFLTDMTTAETVLDIVKKAIKWAAKQPGLFPLRGDKKPKAKLQRDKPDPNQVAMRYSSHLTRYFVRSGFFDEGAFGKAVQSLAEKLTNTDGVTYFHRCVSMLMS